MSATEAILNWGREPTSADNTSEVLTIRNLMAAPLKLAQIGVTENALEWLIVKTVLFHRMQRATVHPVEIEFNEQ